MPHLTLKSTSVCGTHVYSVLCAKTDEFSIDLDLEFERIQLCNTLVAYEFAIMLSEIDQHIAYSVNDSKYSFHVPSKTRPINILYTSCNDIYQQKVWDSIHTQHAAQPYHIAIGGGDQIYMDDVWNIPSLSKWKVSSYFEKTSYILSDIVKEEIAEFYSKKYDQKWFHSPEYVGVLPNIPSIDMWDDHEIVDGFGSYPDDIQNSPIMQYIYKVARSAFLIYQLHVCPTETNQNLTGFFEINDTLIVNTDTRTERTRQSILSVDTHNTIFNTIEQSNAPKVIVLLSTAVAFYDVSLFSKLYNYLPKLMNTQMIGCIPGLKSMYNLFGLPEYNDDMCDGWCDNTHAAETDTFVGKLLQIKKGGKNVVILVGDVHIGADAWVEKDNVGINQYISSGVGSITSYIAFNAMKLCSAKRTSGGITYGICKNTVIHNYNWAGLIVGEDFEYTHYHV